MEVMFKREKIPEAVFFLYEADIVKVANMETLEVVKEIEI